MANTKNYKIILLVLMTLTLSGLATATCTTSTETNSTDFLQINQSSYNTISMGTDELWGDFTFFTPRLNFTHVVYESITGQMVSTNYTLGWKMISSANNFSSVNSTFVLKNGTNVIPTSNYTLSSTDNSTYKITFLDSRYNGTLLTAQFNRTFVKNVDDIFLNATGISGLGSFSTFIQSNTPTDYGTDKTFRPHPSTLYGDSINLSDWSVGWEYTLQDCTADCDKPVNDTLLNVILTMFIIGGLVFLGYSVYQGQDFKTIIILVVGFIIFLIGLLIVKSVLTGVCGTL